MAKPYQILANLLALFAIVYVGVDSFYRVIHVNTAIPVAMEVTQRPTTAANQHKTIPSADYSIINKRNIFGALPDVQDDVTEDQPDLDVLAQTALKLTLLGTIGASNGEGRAIIRDDINKKQNIYREGDAVQGALIKNIYRAKVVLRVEGRDEILTMKKGKVSSEPAKESASSKKGGVVIRNISLSRADLEAMKANLSNLLTSVTFRPYIRSGTRLGMIITKMKSNSGMEKLGLQKGDVIKTINNKALKSIGDALLLYEKLTSGGNVSLEMIRRGKDQQIRYTMR